MFNLFSDSVANFHTPNGTVIRNVPETQDTKKQPICRYRHLVTQCNQRGRHNCEQSSRSPYLNAIHGKGKGHPIRGNEGEEERYSSILSLTSALDGGGWSTPRPKTLGCKTVICACPIATYVTKEGSRSTFRRSFGHICNTLTYALWCAMGLLRDHNIKYIQRSKCWSENLNGRVRIEGK